MDVQAQGSKPQVGSPSKAQQTCLELSPKHAKKKSPIRQRKKISRGRLRLGSLSSTVSNDSGYGSLFYDEDLEDPTNTTASETLHCADNDASSDTDSAYQDGESSEGASLQLERELGQVETPSNSSHADEDPPCELIVDLEKPRRSEQTSVSIDGRYFEDQGSVKPYQLSVSSRSGLTEDDEDNSVGSITSQRRVSLELRPTVPLQLSRTQTFDGDAKTSLQIGYSCTTMSSRTTSMPLHIDICRKSDAVTEPNLVNATTTNLLASEESQVPTGPSGMRSKIQRASDTLRSFMTWNLIKTKPKASITRLNGLLSPISEATSDHLIDDECDSALNSENWSLSTGDDGWSISGPDSTVASSRRSITSFQTSGSENSTRSPGAGYAKPRRVSSVSQNSSLTSTSKLSFSSGPSIGDEDQGDDTKKHANYSLDGANEKDGKAEEQIPCFIDHCLGKDKHVSEMIRNSNKHHGFYVCVRCYVSFETSECYQSHQTSGEDCDPYCISSFCDMTITNVFGNIPSERRHRRTANCPSYKMVSTKDRWQYLYHLRYPERFVPEPLLQSGFPHPHGAGRQRPPRKHRGQPSNMLSLQRQLAGTQSEFQAFKEQQAHKDRLQEITIEQQCNRLLRLENIIAACVTLMSDSSGVPTYLQRMIAQDAPGIMNPIQQRQGVSMDNDPLSFGNAVLGQSVQANITIPEQGTGTFGPGGRSMFKNGSQIFSEGPLPSEADGQFFAEFLNEGQFG